MKKNRLFVSRCIVAMLIVLVTGIFSASLVFAEPYIPNKMVIYMDKDTVSDNIYLGEVSSVTKLKSSKPAVATVSKFKYEKNTYVGVAPKKTGSATVSFSYKYKGKTYNAKVPVVVRKYVNPLKSLKIGSTNLTSKFNKTRFVSVKKNLKGTLKISVKPGYKIFRMEIFNMKDGSGSKEVKNNQSLTVAKGQVFYIALLPKNSNDVEEMLTIQVMVE